MDVKQAVDLAKRYFFDLFSGEGYIDLGLEEINFDEPAEMWEITIGFRRPLPKDFNSGSALAAMLTKYALDRSYKVVRISNRTGLVVSVKNREIQTS